MLKKADARGARVLARRTELNMLQKIHHPHCVQFLGASTHAQPYMIVTEFLPGGSLADVFRRGHSCRWLPASAMLTWTVRLMETFIRFTPWERTLSLEENKITLISMREEHEVQHC